MVFWLSIFGMICWGIAPVFAKVGLNNLNPLPGLIIRTLMAAGFIVGFLGFNGNMQQIKSLPFNTWFLIAIEALLATLVGDLAYYAAIKKGDISVVTIIMSSSPLVTMLVSTIFLGEQLTPSRILGASLVIAGIIIIM
ncbi:putative transporter, EamA-like family [Gottschalkia purinilytica]|uniref:Putative transporter, EamA-like family n=1 Tax=Gottschalkia purinilytica TaxID=1503 RepID=A0A0L0W820_GOTPU|nr:EamA family transporter [Gottschalkia purinilytica]KNF07718.1 putative transporter, EamA-like family [Gottschalkia purinilytica]